MNEDEARDAYLQGALRHAPDALAGPPPALSEAILREAQAKARDPRLAPAPPSRSRRWDWLTRPSAASGFAGVMLAVLVGLMWREQTSDRAPLHETAPASPTAAAAPQSERMAEATAPQASPQLDGRRLKQPAEAQARAVKPTPVPAARDVAPPRAMAQVEAAPPTSAAAPEALAQAQARTEAGPEAVQRSGVAAIASASGSLARMAPPAAPARAAASVASPLTALRQVLADDPARWSWQRGSDPATRPVTPALRDWLAALAQAAADTPWQPALPAGSAPAQALQLQRDGQLAELLWWEGDSLHWQHGTQPPQQLRLPAGPSQALQQALQDATR